MTHSAFALNQLHATNLKRSVTMMELAFNLIIVYNVMEWAVSSYQLINKPTLESVKV